MKPPEDSRNSPDPFPLTRRRFMDRMTRSAAAATILGPQLTALGADENDPFAASQPQARKKVALIASEVRKYSHAQHFIDRLVEGYGWHGRHHRPALDLVSLYVDQFPKNDLARDRERRHGVKIHPTIADALTLGTSKLAVDGVILIIEHGDYPMNEKGQKLYPRYKFFKEVVEVFESNKRSVPVFNDKHYSTDWDECAEMVADSRRLGFALLAGSSLPVTWRIPAVDIPLNTPLEESVCVCYGGVDSYDIHGFETAQCMSERRKGGESGVRQVHALKGDRLWEELNRRPGTWELALAALSRSLTLKPPDGYSSVIPDLEWARSKSINPVGWFVDHQDGFKTTLLALNGLVSDFNYAGRESGTGKIHSCQMHLPMPPRYSTLADFFNPLSHHIEKTILTGRASYPPERTLLTSGMTCFGVDSLFRGGIPIATPQMIGVSYQVDANSTYWRA